MFATDEHTNLFGLYVSGKETTNDIANGGQYYKTFLA